MPDEYIRDLVTGVEKRVLRGDTTIIGTLEVTGGLTNNNEAVGDATPVTVLSRMVTLTDAQIKALPSTPIEIVPAAGAEKAIIVINATTIIDRDAGFYTNLDADGYLAIGTDAVDLMFPAFNEQGSSSGLEAFIGSNNETRQIAVLSCASQFTAPGWGIVANPIPRSSLNNKAVVIKANNGSSGNLTGGNSANSLRVSVAYFETDV